MGLILDLIQEQEARAVGDPVLSRDWKDVVEQLARVIAPVADEVKLTELLRIDDFSFVKKCQWLVETVVDIPMMAFILEYAWDSGWHLKADHLSPVRVMPPYGKPDWKSAEVREFLKKMMFSVEPKEPKEEVAWVVTPWDGEADWDEPQVLVGFWDKYVVEEMGRVVQDGLQPLVTGGDDHFRVTGASIEVRGSHVKAFWLRPDRAMDSRGLPGEGLLIDAAHALRLRGEPLRSVVLELRDDGMLLVRSDEEQGWATIDLLTIDRVLNAAE